MGSEFASYLLVVLLILLLGVVGLMLVIFQRLSNRGAAQPLPSMPAERDSAATVDPSLPFNPIQKAQFERVFEATRIP